MAVYRTSSRYRSYHGGIIASRVAGEATSYYQYITKDGETFANIAARVLNDGSRYWEIADINPQVQWPDTIPTGTLLRIPR